MPTTPEENDRSEILETERLLIRPQTRDDLDDLFAILGDAETLSFYPAPFSRADVLERWIQRSMRLFNEAALGHRALIRKSDGSFVGQCGFLIQEIGEGREIELGWHVHRSLWGHGYAPEAAAALRDLAFGVLGLDHLISLIRPENLASRRVAEKIGMTVRERIDFHELPHDVWQVIAP